MLIKMLTGGGSYEKSLKRRRAYAAAILCVGVIGFVCYFLLVPDSGLNDFAQGFYLGAASGITAGALILLVRTQYLLTHPDAQRRAKIKETDEREVHITQTSFRLAGVITFFVTAAALFVLLPLSVEAYYALLGVLALYALAFLAVNLWMSKKL